MKSQQSDQRVSRARPNALSRNALRVSTLQSVSLQNVLIAGWVLTIVTVAIALGHGG